LPNKLSFNKKIKESIEYANKFNTKFAFLFIDLDLFKRINDTLGHIKGDELLIIVANRLKEKIRKIDFISRIGGDEFLLIIDRLDKNNESNKLINNILDCFNKPFILDNLNFNITCSIGVSFYPDHSNNAVDIQKYADIAMYNAKEKGRNNVVIFDDKMKKGLMNELILSNDMIRAIENDEFILYYQPQVNSNEEHIIGVEALIRWNHPELGFLTPYHFIDLAEKTGQIIEIGKFVIEKAAKDLRIWKDKGLIDNFKISVNISPKQFVTDELISFIKFIMKKYNHNPKDFEFEIAESVAMDKSSNSIDILNELKKCGFSFSIDKI